MKKYLNNKGYTLVEVLLYVSIMVVLLSAVVNFTLLLSSSYSSFKQQKSLQVSALSVMKQVTTSIKLSDSIDSSGTILATSTGSLLLRGTDSIGGSHTTKFHLSNGQVVLSNDGVVIGPLNDSKSIVTSLVFRQIDSGESSAIKIEMTIGGKNFYSTAILRGSYN